MKLTIPKGVRVNVSDVAGLSTGQQYWVENRTLTPGWIASRKLAEPDPSTVDDGHYLAPVGHLNSKRKIFVNVGDFGANLPWAWYVYSEFGDMEIQIERASVFVE